MNITPDTNIRLLKCPLKLDNKNQITFSSSEAQYNYFNSLPKIEVEGSYYQRKDSSIYYPDNFDDLLEYNYVMYQNENYSNKWFYAFITDIEYISDNCTRLEIATDVFQTWQFDLEYKQSFVVREHANDDTIGSNLVEENLDIGELIAGTTIEDYQGYNITSAWVGVLCDYDPKQNIQYDGLLPISGTTFGSKIYLFTYDNGDSQGYGGIRDLNRFISYVNEQKGADQIKNIFMIPNAAVDITKLQTVDMGLSPDDNFKYNTVATGSIGAYLYGTRPVPKPYGTYTDYTPKNNKCYIYPYSFLRVSNNVGNVIDYRWEDFSDTIPNFKSYLTPSIGVSGILVPQNYKGISENVDAGLPLAKYPVCAWSADSYTNWLTQNAVNRPLSFINSLIGTVTGAGSTAMGQSSGQAPQGAINNKQLAIQGMQSMAGTISQDIGNMHEAGRAPNISQNTSNGDVLFSAGANGYLYQYMRIKTEYLKMIDNYFTMFGYKTNLLKVPNVTGRSNWNYVETRNINILGNIPSTDLETIKQMFNSGLTLWHTTTYFLDYSRTNSII